MHVANVVTLVWFRFGCLVALCAPACGNERGDSHGGHSGSADAGHVGGTWQAQGGSSSQPLLGSSLQATGSATSSGTGGATSRGMGGATSSGTGGATSRGMGGATVDSGGWTSSGGGSRGSLLPDEVFRHSTRFTIINPKGGVEERFEYVVSGTATDISTWLDAVRGQGVYVSETRSVDATVYALVLSPLPLQVPDALAAVTFGALRAGDRSGTLSWLWQRIELGE